MNYLSIFWIIFFISLATTGVAFILVYPKKINQLKFLKYLIFISFLADLTQAISYNLLRFYIPNIGATYRMVELIILLEFYVQLLKNKHHALIARVLALLAIILFVVILPFESTPIKITSSIVFSVYALLYFRKTIVEMKIDNPLNDPLFWSNSAILLYFSGCLFLFLFFDPLAELHKMSAVISYMFHNILLIARNILIVIAFFKAGKLLKLQKI